MSNENNALADAEALAAMDAAAETAAATDETAATDEEDLWGAAMAEQESSPEAVGEDLFKPLDQGAEAGTPRELEMVMDIPVKLNVELGRTRISIKSLLELTQGSVIELDGLAGDPMDILINGHLIAQGEVVVVDDKYGIRVTDIITPSERAQKLNR